MSARPVSPTTEPMNIDHLVTLRPIDDPCCSVPFLLIFDWPIPSLTITIVITRIESRSARRV